MFCPNCRSEYVEGITVCQDCDVALVADLPVFEDSDEALHMVRLTGPREAPMIRELLTNNGVDAILQGEVSASELPAMGDLNEVRVWVPESQADRASELIEAFFGDGNDQGGDDAPNTADDA